MFFILILVPNCSTAEEEYRDFVLARFKYPRVSNRHLDDRLVSQGCFRPQRHVLPRDYTLVDLQQRIDSPTGG